MHRREALLMIASSAIVTRILNASPTDDEQQSKDHLVWVSDVLQEMLTIKPGMTRLALLNLFTTEGGISTRAWRTYISRRCRLFKVDVKFRAVVESDMGETPDFLYEGDNDIITKISRPYLQFEVMD